MTAVRATPWPAGEPFRDPPAGAFCFTDPPDRRPRFMRLACPSCRAQSLVPIAPVSFASGESYAWNGDRERPTLTGTIVCEPAFSGCGWRGTLTAGFFETAAGAASSSG